MSKNKKIEKEDGDNYRIAEAITDNGNTYAEEQINSQNILDGIPKNTDDFIDIIEVKLSTVELFGFDKSHKNYYSSSELTKVIAQTQNYIFELEKITVDDICQSNNDCIIARPRGIILIG